MNKRYTLIEVLVVIAILAILTGMIWPAVVAQYKRSSGEGPAQGTTVKEK